MNTITIVALALSLGQAQNPQTPPPPAPQQTPAPAAAAPAVTPLPSAGPVLTFEAALAAARERSLDLKAIQAQVRQADEISWKAWSGYLPQVVAGGSYTHQKEVQIAFGPGIPPVELQKDNLLGAQVTATQTLLSPQLFFGIRSAQASEEAAHLNLENGRRAVLFGVARAYYGVASLKEALGVSERLLEIAQRQEKDARVRYQAGAIAKVALLRAEIDRARAEQDLKRAQNAYLSAKVALATLLARDTAFEVAAPPEVVLPSQDADALAKQALTLRPDLKAAQVQVRAEEQSRWSAFGRYLPDIAAYGKYQWSNTKGLTGEESVWSGGLQAQWTILDGFRRESDIRERGARVDEARVRAEAGEWRIRQEVQQAVLDLDSARANAAKAREQRDLAAENQRLVDVAYRAGTATAVEQADATAQLRNAEIAYVTESLNAQLAAVQVLNVIGLGEPGQK